MKRESILIGVIGLLLGAIIAGTTVVVAINSDNHNMMRSMGMNPNHYHEKPVASHREMSMAQMNSQLENLSGDEFDMAFTEMMIAHHEGAIEMANLIPTRAKHDELKKMGLDIVNAQSKEIAEMQQWQTQWGYSADEVMQMMHGGH